MLKIIPENDYGEETLEIKLSPSYYLYIKETNTKTKSVELSEYNVLWSSNEFSFTSDENIKDVIVKAFEKSYEHINSKSGERWERERMERQMKKAKKEAAEYIDSDTYKGKWSVKEEIKSYYKIVEKNISKQVALKLFQKNNIDLYKFKSNYNELSGSHLRAYIKVEHELEPTESIEELYKPPPAYPAWYCAAFPDVVLWTMDAIESDDEGVMSRVQTEVEALESGNEERLSNKFLKYITNRYKEDNELECSK